MPNGDFDALRLTAEVFLAHTGIKVQVRNGGTIIGKQGSSLSACLCLLLLAPVRLLPKRVRIDVVEEASQVRIQASLDDSFFLPKLGGLVAGRYRKQFDEWLGHLHGQVLPSDIPDAELHLEPLELDAPSMSRSRGHARNEATTGKVASVILDGELPQEAVATEVERLATHEVSTEAGDDEFDLTGLDVPPESSTIEEPKGATVQESPAQDREADEPQATKASERAQNRGQASKNAPAEKASSPRRRRLHLSRFGFGRRKTAVAEQTGLPEEARRHADLADEATEAKAWSKALTHYDAAIQSLAGSLGTEATDSTAASRLFFRRGLARFTQGQSSLGLRAEAERSVSDYQIAIETTRQAMADYTEAIRLDPGWPMGYYRRGEAHLFAARCELGSMSFRRASEELTEAIQDLTHASERNPTFASAFAIRAVAHFLLDQAEESEADAERAASLGTDMATLRTAIQASKSWRA